MNLPSIVALTALLGIVAIVLQHLWRASIERAEQRAGNRGFLQGRLAERREAGELAEADITEHPDYRLLLDIYRGTENPTGRPEWPEQSALHGVQSYLRVIPKGGRE